MAKPTFIYVGPGRTATSWLKEMLQDHPEVGLSSVKETEFFNNNYDKGITWYEGMFPSEEYAARGEISTMYYIDDDVPARIKAHYPDVKILFGSRHPQDLLESFYQFGVRRGVAAATIAESLTQPNAVYMGSGYKDRVSTNTCSKGDHVSMLDSVLLSGYLESFISTFGAQNVHVVSFDEISETPADAIESLYRFIGVDKHHRPAGLTEKINPSLAPKSKLLALAAHKLAYALRKLGLNNLLSTLHESRLIKSLLFKNATPELQKSVLDESVIKILESDAIVFAKILETQRLGYTNSV